MPAMRFFVAMKAGIKRTTTELSTSLGKVLPLFAKSGASSFETKSCRDRAALTQSGKSRTTEAVHAGCARRWTAVLGRVPKEAPILPRSLALIFKRSGIEGAGLR